MTSLSRSGAINMDGSDVPFFRYTMPPIVVKHEGKGKMKKSVLVNIKDVSEKVGRPADYLITYLGQKLNATTKVEKEIYLSYVTGHQDVSLVQKQIFNFIQDAVVCRKCHFNPETSCHIEGRKKNKVLFLQCKGCGKRSDLDSSDRFVKHMISHHAEDANYGHAGAAANADDTKATSTAGEKRDCPRCQHRTAKAVCSKCGSKMDGDTFEQSLDATDAEHKHEHEKTKCPNCCHKTSKPLCSKCGTRMQNNFTEAEKCLAVDEGTQDLVGTVSRWMTSLEESHGEVTLDDFIARVKSEGFIQTSPLDHLGAVVQAVADRVGTLSIVSTTNLQPVKVAQEAKAFVETWSGLIEELRAEVEDDRAAADMVIGKVQAGIASALTSENFEGRSECVVLGLLLALREVNGVADGLLEGCVRLENRSSAMNKFIDFLAEESDGDLSDEDDEEADEKGE